MEYYWICLRADNTAGLYKTEPNKVISYADFEYIKEECGMKWAEIVAFRYHDIPYTMMLDEEGKLRNKPINDMATDLYNNPFDVIVGDVAILSVSRGEDMEYMDEDEAMELFRYIESCSE